MIPSIFLRKSYRNHDSAPKDHFPESNQTYLAYEDYITDGSFGDLLDVESQAVESFKKCGYYVLKNKTYAVNVTQTFIVLNTALYYHNSALNESNLPPDPCGQFEWLQETLTGCKPTEKVFIVAHVPPGYFEHYAVEPMFMNENYTNKFMDIVTDKDNAKKVRVDNLLKFNSFVNECWIKFNINFLFSRLWHIFMDIYTQIPSGFSKEILHQLGWHL